MYLDQYLFEKKMKLKDFADQIHYSKQTVYSYMRGKSKVSIKFAKTVEKITKGVVTAREVLSFEPYMKKQKPNEDLSSIIKEDLNKQEQPIENDEMIFCKDCLKKFLQLMSSKG